MSKNKIVWLIFSSIPIFIIFLFWNLDYYGILVPLVYGITEWLVIRPYLNLWRLRYVGIKEEFSYWQRLNLMFTHGVYLWSHK